MLKLDVLWCSVTFTSWQYNNCWPKTLQFGPAQAPTRTGAQEINKSCQWEPLKIKTNREIKSYRQHMWYYGLENHSLMLVKYPSEQQQRQEVNAWSQTSDDFWRANRLCWCYTWKAFRDSLLCQHIYLSKAESRKSCATSPGCSSYTCECLLSASKLVYH